MPITSEIFTIQLQRVGPSWRLQITEWPARHDGGLKQMVLIPCDDGPRVALEISRYLVRTLGYGACSIAAGGEA